MALVPCPECGREVSTQATACPHCGAPIGPQPQPKGTGVGTVAAGTFGGIFGCFVMPFVALIALLMFAAMCQP